MIMIVTLQNVTIKILLCTDKNKVEHYNDHYYNAPASSKKTNFTQNVYSFHFLLHESIRSAPKTYIEQESKYVSMY